MRYKNAHEQITEMKEREIYFNSANCFIDPAIKHFTIEEYKNESCFFLKDEKYYSIEYNESGQVEKIIQKICGYDEIKGATRSLNEYEIDFDYIHNKHGFRSIPFDYLKKENYNILVAGCSITYGHGLPLDLTWPEMLKKKIKNEMPNKNIDLYNLGVRGTSIMANIKNIFTFINLYGKPDAIFVVMTETARDIVHDNEDLSFNPFRKVIYREELFSRPNSSIEKKWVTNFNYGTNMLKITTLIFCLETLCNQLGIKLLWSAWTDQEKENFKNFNFSNLIDTPSYSSMMIHPTQVFNTKEISKEVELFTSNFRKENINNLPFWEHGRDGQHPGTCFSTKLSDVFFNEWRKNV